ncbi:MAG: hypothetical protein JWO35_779 [Candidatus Saccharibacteria bacterium]|nr:hypothetical protein [Candidatus Saccharibacteria bacterium]
MNQHTRTQKISEITSREQEKYGRQDIPWKDRLEPMDVYKIPLEYLVYNKYNGRILSRTKSLEKQHHKINEETEDGKRLLEDLLFESNQGRNKQTLESLKKIGQEKVGIITRDGIIIDGNRRAMLLAKAGTRYFKAVVLPVTLEENPLEIEKLETSYQMGEDEKLGYNPTEKYLKAKQLQKQGVPISDIARWMAESEGQIKENLYIMEIMDDYLDYLGINGIYTQLDNREDQFITLSNQLKNFYGENSAKPFDGYRDSDVDDLKNVSFDYIRVKYEGKDFRNIAYGLRENHFFGNKVIWEDFRDFHFNHMKSMELLEAKIDLDSQDLEAHLNARDTTFNKLTQDENGKSFLNENMEDHIQKLRYNKAKDQPAKLAKDSIGALQAIDPKHNASSKPEVVEQIQNIADLAFSMLTDKSPKRVMSQVVDLLSAINLKGTTETKEELLAAVKEIEKQAYKIEKEIKSSL